MTASGEPTLSLSKCMHCHTRFAPVDGPCPKCASPKIETYSSSGVGRVLAATALEVPPPAWKPPHLLALVEVEDGVRLLAVCDALLPSVGSRVAVAAEGGVYRARPTEGEAPERGEGETPGAGRTGPPFEPPR